MPITSTHTLDNSTQAPAILEHNAPDAFTRAANDWKRKSNSVVQGKGSRPRTNTASKVYRANYDAIFHK
jgi:hypothetical protein